MKVYLIHKIGDRRGRFEKSAFYGYTNKKSLIDTFKEEREMDLFMILEEFMEKDEYNTFKNNYLSYELGVRTYVTHTDFSVKALSEINIVSTRYEEEMCYLSADKVFNELGKCVISDLHNQLKAFNKDIRNALTSFYYQRIIDFFDSDKLYFQDSFTKMYSMDDMNLKIDTLGLFIYFYGETLKKKW